MPLEPRPMTGPRFILGAFLVLMGAAWFLDQMGLGLAHHLMRFWPLILIALGLAMLQRDRRGGSLTGLILIVVGAWLLLNTLGLVMVDPWEFIGPLILVAIGARIVMRGSRSQSWPRRDNGSPSSTSTPPEISDHATLFSFLGSSRRRWGQGTFRSAEATCVMGGCELDLRDALLTADGIARIDVFIVMGGLKVFVPPNWTVTTHVSALIGGVEDKTRNVPSSGTQQLIISGMTIMGGVEVSN
jgi:predicted membrane protein